MHPQRQSYTLRLLSMVALLLGLILYAYLSLSKTNAAVAQLRPVVPDMQPAPLPADEHKNRLSTALSWLRSQATEPFIATLEPSLISRKPRTRAATSLTMLIPHGRERLALIDGRVFRKGDILADGRQVTGISARGVELTTSGQRELIPWIPPLSVRLEKAPETPLVKPSALAEANATASPVQGQTLTLDAQQALQLLKQLESVQNHAK